ncbi:alpha-amylase [Propioniciclava coleopterorum]|uniref:Alpha-amylase n=1 Tax=Propioniciclava coleopterorum TaxID=2714937 RepID=A0A6G7Y2G7_9ACTN|nr:alpha-amylase family protein [Propioniciclava coleopterorum]QIK71002.1 alpha-amylase [Propioniciclava coleopterorum]
MSLVDHAIWWQVYPLGALGAPVLEREEGVHHRLERLEPWLDYVVELGCSGVLLGPIFASTAHGYDTVDHDRIDPRLGDDADFDRLVAACHDRGLALMLDGVFNHVGAEHPLVAADSPLLKHDGDALAVWEGHDGLVELDHARPEVADLVVDIMLRWLRRGIAGWRLDVAYAVPPAFWREVTGRVKAEFPDAVFLGEVIHGDYAAIAREGDLDSITAYELWKGIWSSIKEANFWELAHALARHDEFSASVVLNTFVGNHDVDRIASLVGEERAPLAAAVLFTVPGMPSVYYGDEQGFTGVRGDGFHADFPVRPPLPASPADLLPTGAWLHDVYAQLIGLRRRHPWLTRARVEVLDKTNESISYRAAAGEESLEVHLTLEPDPGVSVVCSDGETWSWTRP